MQLFISIVAEVVSQVLIPEFSSINTYRLRC